MFETGFNIEIFLQQTATDSAISVAKKTVLLDEGKIADRLYLVKKGCLRLFFLHDGKDITFQFFTEGEIVASFDSLYFRQPSMFSLETLEDSELIVVKRDEFYQLLSNHPDLRSFYEEKLIERFSAYQKQFLSHIKFTPQQRYDTFMKEFPDLIQRIPQHYIASYLGISPVSLSRIRNRRT